MSNASPPIPHVAVDAVFEDERVRWEPPEVVATVVLAAVGIIALGGLVGAVVYAASNVVPGAFSPQAAWEAVGRGAAWSGPILTMILLGILAVCWWQARAWAALVSAHETAATAAAHLYRSIRIAAWAVVATVLSVLGAVASVVSVIGFNRGLTADYVASVAIPVGADALAVLLLAATGLWLFTQIRRLGQTIPVSD
jgi:hypothetical protein